MAARKSWVPLATGFLTEEYVTSELALVHS
jgi:hypothetical protein